MTATLDKPLRHGSESAYRTHGCRCDECRAGRAARAHERYVRLHADKPKKPKPKPKPKKIEHGTVTGYVNYGCRCQACGTAQREYRQEKRNNPGRKRRTPLYHGTNSGYDRGCRCDECRHARSIYIADWRLRTGRTSSSNTRTTIAAAEPVALAAMLEARDQALSLTIARAPRGSATALEARHRRTEVRDLLEHLKASPTP